MFGAGGTPQNNLLFIRSPCVLVSYFPGSRSFWSLQVCLPLLILLYMLLWSAERRGSWVWWGWGWDKSDMHKCTYIFHVFANNFIHGFLQPARVRPSNLTWSNGRLRKDKRQTCRKLGSGGLGALVETHTSLHHLQRVYYVQGQTRKWDSEVSSMTL
jgi:hypothetical protein